jgi:hypothetical protein
MRRYRLAILSVTLSGCGAASAPHALPAPPAAAPACCVADMGAFSPGLLRGRVDLDWTVLDPGVASYQRTRDALRIELEVAQSGRIVFRVRGRRSVATGLFAPGAPPAQHASSLIDDTWTGRVVHLGKDSLLRLESSTTSPSPRVELRCSSATETVGGERIDIVRCTPTALHVGSPWTDPAPTYLRVPVIVAVPRDVLARISGKQGKPPEVSLGALRP